MKKTILKSLLVPLSAMFFVAAGPGVATSAERVTAGQLKSILESKENVVLIDVRTPQEHYEAHIQGSVLMPLDTLEGVSKLPESGKKIIYCRSGKRSLKAIEILEKKGFRNLTDLEGGINAWMAIGGPVKSRQAK